MSLIRHRARIAALATVAALAAVPVHAQGTPTAAQVLDKFVAAIGGRPAWERKTSMRATQEIAFGAMNATGELVTARADRMLLRYVLPFGEIRQGFDGTVAWAIDPMQGARIVTGRQADYLRYLADWRMAVYAPGSVTRATVVGAAEFEGRTTWQVALVPAVGPEVTEYFDQETGLRLGQVLKVPGELGDIDVRTVFRDYTTFGDVRLARTTVQQNAMAGDITITISSVEFDRVPDTAFALPEAIKALRK